ncbi:MAG: ATP-binding protein [Chloroflexi bacterium]|nr:MAG: ATP-binding protein [Chloroflexota bacterium]
MAALAAEGTARGLATTRACALWGLDAQLVRVEVDVAPGLPSMHVVGLADAAIREARERVRSAVRNSGFEFPLRRITVNLAPADRRKEGTGFDLAIAVGVLRASGQLQSTADPLLVAELALDGSLRPVRGCLPRVAAAAARGVDEVVVSRENASEAAAVDTLAVRAARTLREVVAHLDSTAPIVGEPAAPLGEDTSGGEVDFADIAGQASARRALEIAAAGGHNVLLVGPPGTGKTLLARAFPGILPAFTPRERFEASVVHSVAGLLGPDRPLLAARPYRAPHHTLSAYALVGGASPPRPGEVSLAHRGALFLDELPEYPAAALEALREPLEDGRITISRAGAAATYPARTILVAAMNPCACGFFGDAERECRCLPEQVARYRARISGPLLDRIDLRVGVPRVQAAALRSVSAEPSHAIRERVEGARRAARARGVLANAELPLSALRRWSRLSDQTHALLELAVAKDRLSSRGYHRVIRVARTIADLESSAEIAELHLAEALSLRREL